MAAVAKERAMCVRKGRDRKPTRTQLPPQTVLRPDAEARRRRARARAMGKRKRRPRGARSDRAPRARRRRLRGACGASARWRLSTLSDSEHCWSCERRLARTRSRSVEKVSDRCGVLRRGAIGRKLSRRRPTALPRPQHHRESSFPSRPTPSLRCPSFDSGPLPWRLGPEVGALLTG